jgi:5-formyltetrahydrofolate cyclo-ligase
LTAPRRAKLEEEAFLRRRVKAELRRRMRGVRATLPASARAEKSRAIAAQLLGLPALARAKTAALFWPMEGRNEIDLRSLDAALRERGVRVAYPKTDGDTGALSFHFVEQPAAMCAGPLGVCEPGENDPAVGTDPLDVIVVPALAVDPRGHRIGYGAGYYDRALARLAPPAVAVAVAFDFQLLVELPNTPEDVPVAFVVTESRTLAT